MPLDVLLDAYRLPWRRRHTGPRLHFNTFGGGAAAARPDRPGTSSRGPLLVDRLEAYFARRLPINDFRQLPDPRLVTAVDIDTGRRVVFGPGYEEKVPISQAVAASCAGARIFRPYRIGKRYFLDGEVARTLSADLAVAAGAQRRDDLQLPQCPEERPDDRLPMARRDACCASRSTSS